MAGNVKVRARHRKGRVEVRMLFRHPMESGLRKDGQGNAIPADHIASVAASVDGRKVFGAMLSVGVSADPYLEFRFDGKVGDVIVLDWEDNQGRAASATATVG